MANTIRIKRRAAGGSAGAPSSLATAELAYNEQDGILYIGYGDGGTGIATSVKSLAGDGAFLTLGTTQTIAGAKDFSTVPTVSGTLSAGDSSTKVATTAFVKSQNYLTGNQTITVSGDATGSGTTAITLTLANSGAAAGTYTKVTVDAKGRVTSAATLSATDIPTLTAAKISDFDTQVRTSRLDQMAAPAADVSWNNYKLTNLAAPIASTDAATKGYVDSAVQGLDVKASVRAASNANITITTPGATVGGVTMVTGDRVLLFGQSTGSQNGIYVWNGASASMTRATDADTNGKLNSGTFVFVEEGTFGDNGYVLTTDNPITIGTTALTFVQFSGAGQISVGSGLTKTGNTLDISPTYPGQTSITTLGTISSGTWQATIVGLAYGGTGSDLSAAALGTIFKKGATGLVAATEGTDFLSANSTIVGGTF